MSRLGEMLRAGLRHEGHLIVLSGTATGQVFALTRRKVTIGRSVEAEITIPDPGVSEFHALIQRDLYPGRYWLQDAGSHNGTFINSSPVLERHRLEAGDRLQIGSKTQLKFEVGPSSTHVYQVRRAEQSLDGQPFQRLLTQLGASHRSAQPVALMLVARDPSAGSVTDPAASGALDHELQGMMERSIRGSDFLAREGGAFVVLCAQIGAMKASLLGERIRHQVAVHVFEVGPRGLMLTVSVGIAILPNSALSGADEVLAAARAALDQARVRGGNCVVIHREGGGT